ncbi:Carboxylesterase, partial [Taphrina deformans PYCC 5710]
MADTTSVVQTTAGPVQGFIDTHVLSDKSTRSLPKSSQIPVQKFLGVPFGQAQRWSQATPVESWTQVRECFEFGPTCPQPAGMLSPILRKTTPGIHPREHIGSSEADMFTVSVFASEGVREGDKVPVMAWIYGGSWKDGSNASMFYDPTNVIRAASRPMIVVSINYRVNIFGFFASKDLIDSDGLVGNYGVRDQLLGLKWVNQNIEKFGGDADNVTIFGESAGAASVGWQVGGIDPIFRRAIAQSGAASTMGYQSVEAHEKTWQLLLSWFKIDLTDPDRVRKARAISAEDLLKFLSAHPALQWAACIESGPNAIWAQHPDVRIAKGEYVESLESLIVGCTQDEGSIFTQFFGMEKSQGPVDKFLGAFGEATPYIKKYYDGIEDVQNYKGKLTDHPVSRFLHDALFDGP